MSALKMEAFHSVIDDIDRAADLLYRAWQTIKNSDLIDGADMVGMRFLAHCKTDAPSTFLRAIRWDLTCADAQAYLDEREKAGMLSKKEKPLAPPALKKIEPIPALDAGTLFDIPEAKAVVHKVYTEAEKAAISARLKAERDREWQEKWGHVDFGLLEKYALLYTVNQTDVKSSTPRFALTTEEAKTWCSSDKSKYHNVWITCWTTVGTYVTRYFHDKPELDLRKCKDNGMADEGLKELGLHKIAWSDLKEILAPAGVKVICEKGKEQ